MSKDRFSILSLGFRKPFLLLELTPLKIYLYLVDGRSNPPDVQELKQTAFTSGSLDATCTALKAVLLPEMLPETREIAVVVNSPVIQHHFLRIPFTRGAERTRLLQREAKQVSPEEQSSPVASFWSFGMRREAGRSMEYVLCGQMPADLVELIVGMLEERNLHLLGITSHAQMLCLGLHGLADQDGQNTALVEVNEREGMLTLFRSGVWTMERRFLTGSPPGSFDDPGTSASRSTDVEHLRFEMERAFQYFKQQFRSEGISQVLLYGSAPELPSVLEDLQKSLGVETTLFQPSHRPWGTSESVDPGVVPLSLYNVASTVARHSRFHLYLDFLPERLRSRRGLVKRRMVVGGLVAVLYLWLGGLWFQLQQAASLLPPFTEARVLAGVEGGQEDLEQLQETRALVLAGLRSQHWLAGKHGVLSGLARDLASTTPAEMRVTAFEAVERQDGWWVTLQGEIQSPSGSHSQALLISFRSRSSDSASLSRLRLVGVEVVDRGGQDRLPQDLEVQAPRNLLTFTLQGPLPYAPDQPGQNQPPSP